MYLHRSCELSIAGKPFLFMYAYSTCRKTLGVTQVNNSVYTF